MLGKFFVTATSCKRKPFSNMISSLSSPITFLLCQAWLGTTYDLSSGLYSPPSIFSFHRIHWISVLPFYGNLGDHDFIWFWELEKKRFKSSYEVKQKAWQKFWTFGAVIFVFVILYRAIRNHIQKLTKIKAEYFPLNKVIIKYLNFFKVPSKKALFQLFSGNEFKKSSNLEIELYGLQFLKPNLQFSISWNK